MGRLKKTIFPSICSLPNVFSSSMDCTSTTGAFRPTEGVATEPPSAVMGTLKVTPGAVSISANSFEPLTHFGTLTACK